MYMERNIFKENKFYIILIVLIVIISSIIMRSSLHDKIILFDQKVIDYVNSHMNVKLFEFFKIFTNFGDFYIPAIILVCILIFVKNKWIFILQSGGYAIAGIITYVSKLLAGRPRPILALIEIPTSYSFPSGHTLTSIVFYTLLCYILTYYIKGSKRIFLIFLSFMFALLIAISRVYLGVHYFSDVIGGIIIGIPCLLMCINIIEKNYYKKL